MQHFGIGREIVPKCGLPFSNPFRELCAWVRVLEVISGGGGGWALMPGEGFEPPTFGLQNRCTTTVLTRP